MCFPNYPMMDKAFNLWKEERESGSYFKGIRMFKETKGNQNRTFQEFKDEITKNGNAIMLIVFRAKFSEGYNFKDELCRTVIVIGLPYPSLGDSKVRLKYKLMGEDKFFDDFYKR